MTMCLAADVSLHEELTNPANLYNTGSVDRLLLGLCEQPAQKRDEFITEELTNHLFQTPSMYHKLYCIVLCCILFVFHESTITIKRDIEHVKSNTSNSVINDWNHTR